MIPDELKIDKINPTFKSGFHKELSCYVPISVLPFFSKILERPFNHLTKK